MREIDVLVREGVLVRLVGQIEPPGRRRKVEKF
jgi:hypothetical protein